MIYRTCQVCGRELELTEENFWIKDYRGESLADKLGHTCKQCDGTSLYVCRGRCESEIPRDDNYFSIEGKYMRTTCRRCRTKTRIDKQKSSQKESRKCSKCLKMLPSGDFEPDRNRCRKCRSLEAKVRAGVNKKKNAVNSWQDPNKMKKCSTCERSHPLTDVYFKPRPGVFDGYRKQCEMCFKPKRLEYNQKWRAKLRKKLGDKEYNRRLTEMHKKWYNKNKAHMQEYRKTCVGHHFKNWKRYNLWMSIDEYKELVAYKPCFFCGHENFDEHINGMCRVDQTLDVSLENRNNYVVACAICNGSKGTLDPITFVDRCKIVVGDLHHSQTEWPVNVVTRYATYANRSIHMGFGEIGITEAEFELFRRDVCHYCERLPRNGCGLDRKNNDSGYIGDNIVSCCGECNYLKKMQDYEDFFTHCGRVSEFCDLSQFPVPLDAIVRSYAHLRQQ